MIVTVICIFSIFYLFNSNVSKRKAFDEIRASVYEEYRNRIMCCLNRNVYFGDISGPRK